MPDTKKTTSRSLPIRAFFIVILALMVGSLLLTAYWRYRDLAAQSDARKSEGTSPTYQFQVSGPSMVPSLYGPACPTVCQRCERSERVEAKFDQLLPRHRICSVCGGALKRVALASDETLVPGDIIQIRELSQAEKAKLKIGDVVAINHKAKLSVKRIAALPGDEITIKGQRILVNNQRLEDIVAYRSTSRKTARSTVPIPTANWLVVDEDGRQFESRWKSDGKSALWQQADQSTWTLQGDTTGDDQWSDWLIYHHRNIYLQDQDGKAAIGPVMDDDAFNLGLPRKLNEADRLAVAAEINHSRAVTLQAAFWSADAIMVAKLQVSAEGKWHATYYDTKPIDKEQESQFPVTKASPIAIRFAGLKNQIQLKKLAVSRMVEFRLRSSDSDRFYPLRLKQGQAFMLGDNVTASEDSRQWGPIPIDHIVGKVINAKTQVSDSIPATTNRE
ncbi:MAG: S26 family signal peptidase [Pirellulaceae bacterium]